LSRFFQDRSTGEYKRVISNAYQRGEGQFLLYPRRISYAQLKELRIFPLFRLGRNKSGLITQEYVQRVKPFGSLASRTIGDVYGDGEKGGKNGLELYFDKSLRGKPGAATRQKVANTYLETIEVEANAGMDIITTIDIDAQDIAEKSLLDGLQQFQAKSGYAVLMEVESGEVKAIVNMQRNADGSYSENQNGAVSDQMEPGSTFKTMSLMAALDDGKVKLSDTVDTKDGIYRFANRDMRDHNYKGKGVSGFHRISLAEALHCSSNIGISRAIVEAYGDNPSKFVDKLYSMKLNEAMNIEIPGAAAPKIRHPKDKNSYWSHTTLPWMSIGYEVQIPPIYTLAFYNAIANNGKLIRPFFVKSIHDNGYEVKQFKTEIINRSICSSSTLKQIQEALLGVVEGKLGTAKNVKSPYFQIAGKTGTAQISAGSSGYDRSRHLVSFCGYFPAGNPQYTCIVVIKEPQGYPSGGLMAGSVFKNIAENVFALKSKINPVEFKETFAEEGTQHFRIKKGYYKSTERAISKFDLKITGESAEWITTSTADDGSISVKPMTQIQGLVPDVTGMGAKDAVYLLEKSGLRVNLSGRGKVVSQSMSPGVFVEKGRTVMLELR
jgi:cell division protein FtsI (penicillin-binding protein 3)